MTEPFTIQDLRDHFAHCMQVLGGVTAASRRLDIDERPLSPGLLQDTAKALRLLIADATAAEAHLTATLATLPNDPPTPQA